VTYAPIKERKFVDDDDVCVYMFISLVCLWVCIYFPCVFVSVHMCLFPLCFVSVGACFPCVSLFLISSTYLNPVVSAEQSQHDDLMI
jgi:hypothetical protein